MPEGKGYGPQNTASVGKTLNYIGNHCYGYSGQQTTDGSVWAANTELLNYTTGEQYIISKFYMTSDMITGNNLFIAIKLNGLYVLSLKTDGNPPYNPEFRDYELLIPPLTNVQFLFGTQGVECTATGIVTGKVYGKIKE